MCCSSILSLVQFLLYFDKLARNNNYREILSTSWESSSQIVPSKAECFPGLISFLSGLETQIAAPKVTPT